MPVVGRCKLCLLDGVELRESHFIPKSAYKLVEKTGGVTPLSIRGSITLQKNEQLKAHLLCDACEDRFNRNGETWVLKYCNRPGTGFKLHDLVQKMQPETEEAKFKMYSMASIEEIDGEKLAYFVLSVLWRGSVHSWKWGKDHQPTASLGSRYEEEFRKYLIGQAGFPENVAVLVYLLSRPSLWDGFTVPRREKLRDGVSRWTFIFLGISFRCLVGNVLDDSSRTACIYRSPKRYFFLGDAVDEVFIKDVGPTLLKSKRL